MLIIKSFVRYAKLLLLILLIGTCQLSALAALQCTSVEVSPSEAAFPPIEQTVTLTLRNNSASAAIIIKPSLTFQQLSNDNQWQDVSDSIFVKSDKRNPWQIASGKTVVVKFQIQLFDDVLVGDAKSTFRVTPHIEYFLQGDNLLPQLTDGTQETVNWQVDNPAVGFRANAFVGHENNIQIHVNDNLLKGRLMLRSAKSTYAAGKKYLVGILNKSDRSGWDSPLNKGASVIEYNDSGAIRSHPLHIFEVPLWNWELMQFSSAANATKIQMEMWMRGWQLHQTGDWWIRSAFVVPMEKVKVLSAIMPSFPRTRESRIMTQGKTQPLDSHRRGNDVVTYLGEDRATQGNWRGAYGNESFILCAMQAPQDVVGGRILPKRNWPNGKKGAVQTAGVWSSWQSEFHYSAETGDPKEQVRHYIPPNELTTNDKRALINPLESERRYASWDDYGETHPFDWNGPDLLVHLDIPKGLHRLSFYFVDWDFADTFRPRASRLFIEEDIKDAKVLSSAYIDHFGQGVYKVFAVRGPSKLRVRITKDASVCAVLSGMFLDEINMSEIPPTISIDQNAQLQQALVMYKNLRIRSLKVSDGKGDLEGFSSLHSEATKILSLANQLSQSKSSQTATTGQWLRWQLSQSFIVNPQMKESAFADYIKSNPPANTAAAKSRVQHLLDNGEVSLARLAVPAWLHRAAAQSVTAEITAFREAVTMFALSDSDYASELTQQLVSHAVKRGGSKVLLLQVGKDLMQLAKSNQEGKLHSRVAYPVAVAYYRRLQGEFGIKGLGEEAAYNFAEAQAECAGYNHSRQKNAVIAYRQYINNWPDGAHTGDALLHLVEYASSLATPRQPQARQYFSLALQAADKLQTLANYPSPSASLFQAKVPDRSKVLLSGVAHRRLQAALAARYVARLYTSIKEPDKAAVWQAKYDALLQVKTPAAKGGK